MLAIDRPLVLPLLLRVFCCQADAQLTELSETQEVVQISSTKQESSKTKTLNRHRSKRQPFAKFELQEYKATIP